MYLNSDTINNELFFIIMIALDRDIYNFEQIELGENCVNFKNNKDKLSLVIELFEDNTFKVTIKSKFFEKKDINNWLQFLNFLNINKLLLENKFNLN